MNARSQIFEISVEPRQVEEAVVSLFHTILFQRSYGKFTYEEDNRFFIGSLGAEDVDCEYIDYTYVRAQSPSLDQILKREVAAFSNDLRRVGSTPSGQPSQNVCSDLGGRAGTVSLEFYQKKKGWLRNETIPWEVWTIRTELVHFANEHERQQWQEKVGEMLADKVMYIAEVINRHDYVPKIPLEGELELVFDTNFPDIQPYLFKISSYTTAGQSSPSMGTTVRRLIKDTLL